MALSLRQSYADEELLPAKGCPPADRIAVWADGHDSRTRDSGRAFLDGAFPACGLAASHGPEGQVDPLFQAAESGRCPTDPVRAQRALEEAFAGLPSHRAELDAAKSALYEILTPPAQRGDCPGAGGPACFLFGQDGVQLGKSGAKLNGALSEAASLAESLMLEYAEDMPASEVGWGRADAAAIARIMPLHNISAALSRRTPYLAAHNGALLARAIAHALNGRPAFPGLAPAVLTVVIGHDTNLSNLAGILGVAWSLPDQPDDTPPGGTLAFELWRDGQGQSSVRVKMIYQPLDDLRSAEAGRPLRTVDLALPGCPPRGCSLGDFTARIDQALPPDCPDR
jgi:4-phytase/acid phosphatase